MAASGEEIPGWLQVFLTQQQDQQQQQQQLQQERENRLLQIIEQQKTLFERYTQNGDTSKGNSTSFQAFESTMELWEDYFSRFITFCNANNIAEDRKPTIFLTNQSPLLYKQLSNLAKQQTPPKEINSLTMVEIEEFMRDQFDPKRFVVRERYNFWKNMNRQEGESIQELAARIRADAATCDFPSIKDPQDEALRQRFICSVNNKALNTRTDN